LEHNFVFDQYRPYLFSVALRMLGNPSDAEDMVQETFLHWLRVSGDQIKSPGAYLTTIVTRLCLDQRRSALRRHEIAFEPAIIEPLPDEITPTILAATEKIDTVSEALNVLVAKLAPLERVVFILHEVFAYNYAEIACLVDKSEANCRQIGRRARLHLNKQPARLGAVLPEKAGITRHFLKASVGGDMTDLISILTERQMSNWNARLTQCCTY
jgi:RNA polymerase sigma-70 factor, ECF subfamily